MRTKLASAGAPGDVATSADSLAWLAVDGPLHEAKYWKGRLPIAVFSSCGDTSPQEALIAACDALRGVRL